MTWETVPLGKLYVRRGTVNPAPETEYTLYSVPSYEAGSPDSAYGDSIKSAKQVVDAGDVLLCRIVPHIRRAWRVGEHERPVLASTEWIALRHPSADPSYLRQYLLGDEFHSRFMSTLAGVGGSLSRARPAAAARIPIPLPPLPEQRRIAAILDEADAVSQTAREVMRTLGDFVPSILRRAMTGAGDARSLRNLGVSFRSGLSVGDGGLEPHATNRILKVSAVSRGKYDGREVKSMPRGYAPPPIHMVQHGDLLMTRASGSLDLIARGAFVTDIPTDTFLPDKIWRVELAGDSPLSLGFVKALSDSPGFRAHVANAASGASGVRNISQSKLLAFALPVPTSAAIAELDTALQVVDDQAALLQRRKSALDALFDSLQHRAFRGEL